MRSTFKIWCRLLLVIILCGCSGSHEREDAVIREAARLMQEQPDSALRVLGKVSRHSLRGETLARYALIHSIAQDKSGQDVTNDSLLRIAYGYYSRHPEDSLYARSQYYMGKYLCLTEQADSAYGCLLRAKTASVSDSDYYTAYLATDRMRRIAEISDTALCLSLSKEAYRLYLKYGAANPANEAYLLCGIGYCFHRRHESDSTLYYYNRALGKARLAGDSTVIASVFQNISIHYRFDGQHKLALDYAQKAVLYQGYLDRSLATLLARCYMENDEYDKARQYVYALPDSDSKESRLVKLTLLHRLAAKTGNADAAQDYFDSACDVAADMYLSTLQQKTELNERKVQEETARREAEYQKELYIICTLFSMALLSLIVWLFLKYYRTNEREKTYKDHLMAQTRNYVKKIVGFQRKLEQYKQEKNNQESKKVRNLLELDDKDWDEIQAFLEACDNSFVTRFREKYPNISEKDFLLCLLLRYGFTNSELELVYSITPQSIKNMQRQLKDKLDIADNKVCLRQYIQAF